ncbi:MAG: radical SAM family heme chaperone HemW [Gammaproteobacteria bacterium]
MLPSPGLYVHLPWCVKKCPYCDFNSHAVRGKPPFEDYTDAVCADLEHQAGVYEPEPFGSVFFGGGTPSLFEPEHIERILNTAQKRVGIADSAEITLEANPGAIEHGSFKGYRSAGVNRISLGVQSFSTDQLRVLGRVHSADDAHKAAEAIHQADIPELNIDLMYGLPNQTQAMALADVDVALSLLPTHLSHYQLTIEPNTLFAVKAPELPDNETCFAMQEACQSKLDKAGFRQYEVSAYAREGFSGKHNVNYWTYGDYLGVGAGAHGKITTGTRVERTLKPKHPNQYLQDPLLVKTNSSSPEECLFEYMLNRLRLNAPIAPNDQIGSHWLKSADGAAKLDQAKALGLMEINTDGSWSKTALGSQFLNDLQEIFLP